MTQEEKAKAYDEAIERARIWKDKSGMPKDKQGILDDIFPELAESEDERIRKALLEGFKRYDDGVLFNECLVRDILAWLEKQQKPADYSVWVGGSEVNDNYLTKEEAEKLADKYRKDGYEDVVIEKVGQKPAWSEEDQNRINRLIAYFEDKESFTAEDDVVYANWLKSLRSQSQWKPTDAQMEYLAKAIATLCDEGDCKTASILNDLKAELKKLRGE